MNWDRLAPRSKWIPPVLCCRCGVPTGGRGRGRRRCEDCDMAYKRDARKAWHASPAGEAARHRLRALRRSSIEDISADLITIRALADRDAWMCHLCGDPVRNVRHRRGMPRMDGPTIDHVVPLARGGAHTWDNVALAHFICNSRRGAKPIGVSA